MPFNSAGIVTRLHISYSKLKLHFEKSTSLVRNPCSVLRNILQLAAIFALTSPWIPSNSCLAQSPPVYTLTPLGAVRTGAHFSSAVLNGNLAYVCAADSVATVDVANPSAISLLTITQSPLLQLAYWVKCGLNDGRLVAFADSDGTKTNNQPGVILFSLTDPQAPAVLKELALNKRFFNAVQFRSSHAFVSTMALHFFLGVSWDEQYGDLLAINLTDPMNPSLVSTLRAPVTDPVYGSPAVVMGASILSTGSNLLYLGGSTSTGNQNSGQGRLQVVDTTNPAAMTVVHSQTISGTVHLAAPLVDGTLGVSVGNNGGFVGTYGAEPGQLGNIVVATFDLTNPQSPALRRAVATQFKPGVGGGSARIGTNRYAFAGIRDLSDREVLLIVDAADPMNPAFQPIPLANPIRDFTFRDNILYAAEGKAGFNSYSLSTTTTQCGLAVDLAIVLDRSGGMAAQTFAEMKTAAQTMVDQLRPSDRVSIVSFTATGTVNQLLTADRQAAKNAIAALTGAGDTSIGAGIASAQQELLSTRRNLSAQPVMVVFSDGRDLGSANPTVTPNAATAAKNAGIRLMTISLSQTSAAAPPGWQRDRLLWAGCWTDSGRN